MKLIKLTKEHKSKLLEMCKALFPEYNEHLLSDQQGRCNPYQNGIGELEYVFFTGELGGEAVKIHWFEFCVTHLIVKLQDALPNNAVWREQPQYVNNVFDWKKGNKWTLYSDFFFHYPKQMYEVHPIDYLYEEFKKLKS